MGWGRLQIILKGQPLLQYSVVQLLHVHNSAEALAILHTDEKSLLAGWRASLVP